MGSRLGHLTGKNWNGTVAELGEQVLGKLAPHRPSTGRKVKSKGKGKGGEGKGKETRMCHHCQTVRWAISLKIAAPKRLESPR